MKRRPALLVALLLLFPAPGRADDNARPLVWAADQDGGIPYVFQDENGGLIGFEVDLKDALSRELGRPIVFKQYAFDALLSGVQRGDFDFAMNGLEITPERQQTVRFSRPYYIYQLQLVARRDDDRFKDFEECKAKNLTVATLGGCAADRLLDDRQVPKRIYEEQEGPYRDLQLGRGVDGVLLDLPVAIYYAVPDKSLRHGKHFTGLKFVGPPFAEGYYGIAVRKDNEALANDLDTALGRLIESGELKRILSKWELWNPDQYRLSALDRVEATEGETLSPWLYVPLLLDGAAVTLFITVTGMALAVLLGLVIATCRLYGPLPVRLLAGGYVEFFRGIPVLLLLYFLYFGLPGIDPDLKLHPLVAAVLGFGLNYAAYEAEIYRAGITAVPVGQWEAAASLGMSAPLTFRRIILPQAIRIILPPMTNDFIALFKDTSVVSVISVVELSKQYQILTKSHGGFVEIGLATALLYLVMSVPLGYLSRSLEKRWGGMIH